MKCSLFEFYMSSISLLLHFVLTICHFLILLFHNIFTALYGLQCADVPLRNYLVSTFKSAELVERLEAGGVVDVVGMESDAEEVAVGADRPPGKVARRAAVARHLAVHQVHVEVRKLDVVALRRFVATARHNTATGLTEFRNVCSSVGDFGNLVCCCPVSWRKVFF